MHLRTWIAYAILASALCGCSAETEAGGPGPAGPDRSDAGEPESFFENLLGIGEEEVAVPAGTSLKVTLESGISSESNAAGDTLVVRFREPVLVDGEVAIAEGTTARGRLTEVRRSGRVEGRARLAMELTEILGEEDTTPVETRPVVVEAESTRERDAAAIAGSTGVGAAIGAIAGGGKGAAVGAAAGAAAGTGGVLLTRGAEVELGPETALDFELAAEVDLPLVEQ